MYFSHHVCDRCSCRLDYHEIEAGVLTGTYRCEQCEKTPSRLARGDIAVIVTALVIIASLVVGAVQLGIL